MDFMNCDVCGVEWPIYELTSYEFDEALPEVGLDKPGVALLCPGCDGSADEDSY